MFNSSRTFAKVPEWPDMKSPLLPVCGKLAIHRCEVASHVSTI